MKNMKEKQNIVKVNNYTKIIVTFIFKNYIKI